MQKLRKQLEDKPSQSCITSWLEAQLIDDSDAVHSPVSSYSENLHRGITPPNSTQILLNVSGSESNLRGSENLMFSGDSIHSGDVLKTARVGGSVSLPDISKKGDAAASCGDDEGKKLKGHSSEALRPRRERGDTEKGDRDKERGERERERERKGGTPRKRRTSTTSSNSSNQSSNQSESSPRRKPRSSTSSKGKQTPVQPVLQPVTLLTYKGPPIIFDRKVVTDRRTFTSLVATTH
jgi:hypothetical protein